MSTIDIGRVGVRGVAGVALATPFFWVYFIKWSKNVLKKIFFCNVGYTNLRFLTALPGYRNFSLRAI